MSHGKFAECKCISLAEHKAQIERREAIAGALERAANANHLLLGMTVLDAMTEAVIRLDATAPSASDTPA